MAIPTPVASNNLSTTLHLDKEKTGVVQTAATVDAEDAMSVHSEGGRSVHIPKRMRILAVLLVSAIGFGSHWSSGVTGAMKSTLKKELHINNTQYALLDGSTDFMTTCLILFTGLLTDRMGGASTMLWGNGIYSVGAILIAAATTVRSYMFMIFGFLVQALGDISTQVAQYKVFSSWFAPSNGFASTLGLELGLGKIRSFVVYWTAVFMNLFTKVATLVFFYFRKWCDARYSGTTDPATGEKLSERKSKFDLKDLVRLPWTFWGFVAFSAFETSTAIVFSGNGTELAEQRFNISDIAAGWYTGMSQYIGFFLVPCLGVFIDVFGTRLSVMVVCGSGVLIAMCLCAFGPSVSGTAASFGVYAFAYSLGPTVIVDGLRTAIASQDTFGAAYAVKIAVNNAMNIIVRIVTGVIQDRDNDSYIHVVIVYVILAAGSTVVSFTLLTLSFFKVELAVLQWTRKHRVRNGETVAKAKAAPGEGSLNRRISLVLFGGLVCLILGSWAAYFWVVATGHND
ncbi:MFS general substrate transporter [Teratosphaeria nubilosa]|uniref:Lysosomal dipeptide transporter MFSD1 n=1 Tax=Teratosphaeria nubilosa TaxID=161662 RepID=A0A6G1L4W1_9PEZI|nr:MFS general substrate transporter [Teratosphaeria nubilosa]